MARLIDADELCSEMQEYVFPITSNNLMGAADAYYRILHLLDDAPTVDAVEVVHGEWIDGTCNNCGQVDFSKPNYCPNCGAKMDGGKKDEM